MYIYKAFQREDQETPLGILSEVCNAYRYNSSPKGGENKMATVQKSMDTSSLAEVVDRILDKGIVVDAWVRVSLVGIEILAIEARVVIASVDTFLKYAEAVGLTAGAAA